MDGGSKIEKNDANRKSQEEDVKSTQKTRLINVTRFLVTCKNVRLERTGITPSFCVTIARLGKKICSQCIINNKEEQIAAGNQNFSFIVTFYSISFPEFISRNRKDRSTEKHFPRKLYTITVRGGHYLEEVFGKTKIDISKHIFSNEGCSLLWEELDSGIALSMSIDYKKIDNSNASIRQKNVPSFAERLVENLNSYKRKTKNEERKIEDDFQMYFEVEDGFDDIKVDDGINKEDLVSSSKKKSDEELSSELKSNNPKGENQRNCEKSEENRKGETMMLEDHVSRLSEQLKNQDEKIRRTMEEISRREEDNIKLERNISDMDKKVVSNNLEALETVERKVTKAKQMYFLTEHENEVLRLRKRDKEKELNKLKQKLGHSST